MNEPSYIDTMLSMSRCPRCGHEFDVSRPAGSRLTEDRSIRICGPCDMDEALEDQIGGDLTQLDAWPVGAEKRDELAERFGLTDSAVQHARQWLARNPDHDAADGVAEWARNIARRRGGGLA